MNILWWIWQLRKFFYSEIQHSPSEVTELDLDCSSLILSFRFCCRSAQRHLLWVLITDNSFLYLARTASQRLHSPVIFCLSSEHLSVSFSFSCKSKRKVTLLSNSLGIIFWYRSAWKLILLYFVGFQWVLTMSL